MPESNAKKIVWHELPVNKFAPHNLARISSLSGIMPVVSGDNNGWKITWHSEITCTTISFADKSATNLVDRWNEFVFIYEHGWHTLEPHYDEGDPEWYLHINQ